MSDLSTRELAVEAIVVLNAALTNIRLYPITSEMIGTSINRAYSIFQDILKRDDSVIFSESERNLIISGKVLSEADKKRPQVTAFTKLMLSLSIKSISFERGLKKEEIQSFLEVISKKPDEIEKEGGIAEVISAKGVKYIHIDKKQFVAMGKDQKIVSAGALVTDGLEEAGIVFGEGEEGDSSDNRRSGKERRVGDSLDHLSKGSPERRKEEQRKHRHEEIKNGINSLLKGDHSVFLNPEVMRTLPPTILRTFSQGKENKAFAIISKLCEGLLSKEDKIRAQVSAALAHIIIRFMTDNRIDETVRFLPEITNWIKLETVMSPGYKHICLQLKGAAINLLSNRRIIEGNQILEPFHMAHSGVTKIPEELIKLSGEILKGIASPDILNILLDELGKSKNDVKEQALKAFTFLTPWSVGFLLEALKKLPESTTLIKMKDKILLQERICVALGQTGSRDALPALNMILERKDPLNIDIFNKEVLNAAKNAVEMIERGPSDKEATLKKTEKIEPTDKFPPGEAETADNEVAEYLKSIEAYANEGEKEKAVKLLFDRVVEYAGKKDFENADLLREKLIEVDPMALTEIVKLDEVIEEAKSEAIDQKRLKTWNTLYDHLNDKETHELYFAMKSVEYNAGDAVFRQGESNSKLYFIYRGKIKLVTNEVGEEITLKELGPGDIFGQSTFFSLSVCTISAIAASGVELDFLEKDAIAKWDDNFPALAQKIKDYCLKLENTSDMLKKKGKSRRVHERVNISGRISVQILDSSGSPSGDSAAGNLDDISVGGVSFYTKTSKEKADKMFLDQKVNVKFNIKTDAREHKVNQNGMVVGVIPHLHEYSVHIKFDNLLDEKIIKDIKESAGSGDEDLDILIDT